MGLQKTKLDNVLLFTPSVFKDHRGSYVELYNKNDYSKLIREAISKDIQFVTDCIAVSNKNVLRGIHGDQETWKLFTCLEGEIYFVVVNCDKESDDFGKWESFILSEDNMNQVLVPAKYGNLTVALSERAIIHYRQSTYYDPENLKQFTYRYDSPQFKIKIPIDKPILSERDSKGSVLIVGASGFIGRRLYEALNPYYEVYGTGFSSKEFDYLDITNKEKLEEYVLEKKPSFIIWLSSKDTKFCEKNPAEGLRVNSEALFSLGEIILKNNINSKLIYFSSDRIFDGKNPPYKENDIPSPVTNYGFSKKLCEDYLKNSGIDYKIIRTSAVLGKNGVFSEWILNILRNGQRTGLFSDNYFTPTPVKMLCENIEMILKKWYDIEQKIIHISGGVRMSRYDFAKNLAEKLDIGNYDIYKEEGKKAFQDDTSIVPSSIIKFKRDFWDYIKEEFEK